MFTTETVSWFEGRDLCNSLGGHLVEIRSLEEQETIWTYLQANTNLSSWGFWTGLNDIEKKGEWVWHTLQPAQYVNLYRGFPPSRIHQKDKECVRIITTGLFAGKWKNNFCTWKQQAFCEKGRLIKIADLQISKVQQVQQKIWRGTIIG